MYTFLMKVCIYSPQFEIAELLAEQLTDADTSCIPFLKINHMMETVINSRNYPDLILLDYLSINHELFNIISHATSRKLHIPFVFFNDPCTMEKSRVDCWISIIKKFEGNLKTVDFNYIKPFLEKLQKVIESDDIRPYIPLLTPSLKLPEKYIKDPQAMYYIKENSTDCLIDFKDRNELPENLYYLLTILQKNRDKSLTYEDIVQQYIDDNKQMSISSLQVLMSRLRNAIRKDPECKFLINKKDKSYRFVYYKK